MIQKPLALGAGKQRITALCVRQVSRVGSEIKLRQVAVQVRLADVVKLTVYTALQEREVALDRVRVMEATRADVLAAFSSW